MNFWGNRKIVECLKFSRFIDRFHAAWLIVNILQYDSYSRTLISCRNKIYNFNLLIKLSYHDILTWRIFWHLVHVVIFIKIKRWKLPCIPLLGHVRTRKFPNNWLSSGIDTWIVESPNFMFKYFNCEITRHVTYHNLSCH